MTLPPPLHHHHSVFSLYIRLERGRFVSLSRGVLLLLRFAWPRDVVLVLTLRGLVRFAVYYASQSLSLRGLLRFAFWYFTSRDREISYTIERLAFYNASRDRQMSISFLRFAFSYASRTFTRRVTERILSLTYASRNQEVSFLVCIVIMKTIAR